MNKRLEMKLVNTSMGSPLGHRDTGGCQSKRPVLTTTLSEIFHVTSVNEPEEVETKTTTTLAGCFRPQGARAMIPGQGYLRRRSASGVEIVAKEGWQWEFWLGGYHTFRL